MEPIGLKTGEIEAQKKNINSLGIVSLSTLHNRMHSFDVNKNAVRGSPARALSFESRYLRLPVKKIYSQSRQLELLKRSRGEEDGRSLNSLLSGVFNS